MRHVTIVMSSMLLACGLAQAQSQGAPAAPAQNAPAANATDSQGPTEVVQTAAQGMLGELDKNRDAYRRDPAKVGQLVDKYLLPHFDTEYSARGVLGQYWRNATPDQRQRFVDAFYHSLLSNYGSALADFTSDRLKILPSNVKPDAAWTLTGWQPGGTAPTSTRPRTESTSAMRGSRLRLAPGLQR